MNATTKPTTIILANDAGTTVTFRPQEDGTVKITTRHADLSLIRKQLDAPAARRWYRRLVARGYYAW